MSARWTWVPGRQQRLRLRRADAGQRRHPEFQGRVLRPAGGDDRCGECHTPGKSGATHFVDQGDVNTAWQQARTVANLEDPAASAVVQRVANGHNCWLGRTRPPPAQPP